MLKTMAPQLQAKQALQSAWFTRKLKHIAQRPSQFSSGKPTVIGFMSSPTGLGYGARLIFNALKEKGYQPNTINISELFYPKVMSSIPFLSNEEMGDGPLIFHINGPELLSVMNALGPHKIRNQKIIAVWAWEQRTLPKSWLKVEAFVDEIWACSHFLEDVFRENLNTPVHYIPYPVASSVIKSENKPTPGQNVFNVYASFDPKSGLERKNPEALIDIFKQGFEGDTSITLTLQISDPDWAIPESWKTLKNVNVTNAILTDREVELDMLNHDCVISLHRCEGFGFLMARALALGLPTIFTQGFGSGDFSQCPGAFTVTGKDYTIQNKSAAYEKKHGQWLDPNINEARAHIERLARMSKAEHIETAHKSCVWWQSNYSTQSFSKHLPDHTKVLFS